jgi:hypothetical protein
LKTTKANVEIEGYYILIENLSFRRTARPVCPYCTGGYVDFEFQTNQDIFGLGIRQNVDKGDGHFKAGANVSGERQSRRRFTNRSDGGRLSGRRRYRYGGKTEHKKKQRLRRSFFYVYFADSLGRMLTCFLLLPMRSKRTTPSAVAKSVSSPPKPTFSPGWIFVPLWRTKIFARKHDMSVRRV